ncbi:MAG: excinuclease ABC subunit UvrC [Candidatus Peregrinibacteria bacterium]|nr:excinuclease ABC subunit UvrC [Candidatus Peregrinibacteria bacterium]
MSKNSDEKDLKARLRARIAKIPPVPGIYRWFDAAGNVIYVGKAKDLKSRLRSYVSKPDAAGPWKLAMLKQLADFEVTVTNTELEALMLETNLIKEMKPKYNVLMKDDKNYVYVRVTMRDAYPRVDVVRRIEDDGAKYFGPKTSAHQVHETLGMLRKLFPFRTCKMEIEPAKKEDGALTVPLMVECHHRDRPTPCLDHHIRMCTAPCVGTRTPEEYFRESIEGLLLFLKGEHAQVVKLVKERMQKAAVEKKFEQAAEFRDILTSMESMQEKQIVSDPSGSDSDIVGVALLSGRAQVVVLSQREGKLSAEANFALQGHPESTAEVLRDFLPQYYAESSDIPPVVVVAEEFPDMHLLEEWLTSKRGTKVSIRVPERGKRSHLLELATRNAFEKAKQQEARWEADARNTLDALEGLKQTLSLPETPHRIECYDISHLGGTETVGSMSVFLKGKPANDQYRSFTLRTVMEGEIDDYKALKEVLERRLRYLTEDLPKEEKEWKEKGISFGKARKAEQSVIEAIHAAHPGDIGSDAIDYRNYLVARNGEKIVAFARLFAYPEKILVLRSVWVDEHWRGDKLGQFIARKILRSVKKGKVYLHAKGSLEEYYASLGFRHVIQPPKVLEEKMATFHAANPKAEPTMIMVFDVHQHKLDPSLTDVPDLLVIDGGKGQLAVVKAVLDAAKLVIPVISLAKREEEVFSTSSPAPVLFPADAPAKFLLMRLRDEAHRFANRHRSKRIAKHTKESALDSIPGIGDETIAKLRKKYGSFSAIIEASDEELLQILTEQQLKALRTHGQ